MIVVLLLFITISGCSTIEQNKETNTLQSCKQVGGNVCNQGDSCMGDWINSSQAYCCEYQCNCEAENPIDCKYYQENITKEIDSINFDFPNENLEQLEKKQSELDDKRKNLDLKVDNQCEDNWVNKTCLEMIDKLANLERDVDKIQETINFYEKINNYETILQKEKEKYYNKEITYKEYNDTYLKYEIELEKNFEELNTDTEEEFSSRMEQDFKTYKTDAIDELKEGLENLKSENKPLFEIHNGREGLYMLFNNHFDEYKTFREYFGSDYAPLNNYLADMKEIKKKLDNSSPTACEEYSNLHKYDYKFSEYNDYADFVKEEIQEKVGVNDLRNYGGQEARYGGSVYFLYYEKGEWDKYKYWAVEVDAETGELIKYEDISTPEGDREGFDNAWWFHERDLERFC